MTSRLAALVRRDLVRPDLPTLPREDAYRFRHLLIRDAAYDALPKATRADLHRRFADWLEEHGQTLVELDEILGYHLEQAALYLAELGQPDAALTELASGRLAAAAVRVRWRGDPEAAHSLLGRAVRLVEQPDVHLAVAFAVSHSRARDAEPLLEEAARRADADGDAAGAALARTLAGVMGLWLGEVSSDEAEQLGLVALPLLEAKQDHAGLAEVWYALGLGTYNHDCRFEQVVHATEMARSYEALVGRPHHRSNGLCAMGLLYGPRPVGEALDRVEALDSTFRIDLIRAQLLLMSDRIEEARALARAAERHARELGEEALSHAHLDISEMESVAGNHEAAAERLQVWCNWCAEQELVAGISSYAAQLARELCLVGRYDEAEQSIARARELDDDAWLAQATWRQAAALLSAHRGEHTAAERLAREALSHLHGTDSTKFHGDAHCDLAVVLEAAGRRDEAVDAWRGALDRYERKGVLPLVRRVRERLGAMAGDAVP